MSRLLTFARDVAQGKPSRLRSPLWHRLKMAFIKKNPGCAACGSRDHLEVHHIKPFHEYPELELVESNWIVLCESKRFGVNCHLALGHAGDYKRINENVIESVNTWREILARARRADQLFPGPEKL